MTVIHEGNYPQDMATVWWKRDSDGCIGHGQLYPLEFAIWFGRIWQREQPDCTVTVVAGREATYGQAA